MDKNLKNYKPLTPKTPSTEEKLQKMRMVLMDNDRCKEIAQKLSAYINQK